MIAASIAQALDAEWTRAENEARAARLAALVPEPEHVRLDLLLRAAQEAVRTWRLCRDPWLGERLRERAARVAEALPDDLARERAEILAGLGPRGASEDPAAAGGRHRYLLTDFEVLGPAPVPRPHARAELVAYVEERRARRRRRSA